mgnify:CR=1 FL=1
MLGAMIGDIVGSVYEWHNIKTKDFPLFRSDCFFTDDTVMTAATADALMKGGTKDDFIDAYREWGRRYPDAGYGGRFRAWLASEDRAPYGSWGNGSAMRVSPCGWLADCGSFAATGRIPESVLNAAALSASVTHNHPEGVKGAQATAAAIFLARHYAAGGCGRPRSPDGLKAEMKQYIEARFGYDLSRTLDEIRPSYRFDESCQQTVPQAITAFLESTGFEDAIRGAVSLGGDSDTLAAITGGIAEAAYGIPDSVRAEAWARLDEPLRGLCRRWQAYLAKN